jgi:tyrosinase
VRQEIRQMENDNEMWTLYLLGLSMMQFTDQSDALSWYQITGVSVSTSYMTLP